MKNIKLIINRILFTFLLLIALSFELIAQAGKVKANGITIAYESFGDNNNDAIILIQGTGATLLHYPVELCKKLASSGFYVIRFDNRDIGLSTHLDSLGQPDWNALAPFVGTCDKAPLPYTLFDMATDVTGLMDALNIRKANIVGASMGGAIAQIMAIHYPERVLSLTSISASSGNPSRPQGDEKALAAMGTPPPATSNPDTLAAYLVNVYKTLGAIDSDEVLMKRALEHIKTRHWDSPAVNRQLAAVLIGDYCDRSSDLAKLKIPVMVIHGDLDPMVPVESGKEVAAAIQGSEFCIIKGMGHDLSLNFVNEIAHCIEKISLEAK